jgi:hypothetical protein
MMMAIDCRCCSAHLQYKRCTAADIGEADFAHYLTLLSGKYEFEIMFQDDLATTLLQAMTYPYRYKPLLFL